MLCIYVITFLVMLCTYGHVLHANLKHFCPSSTINTFPQVGQNMSIFKLLYIILYTKYCYSFFLMQLKLVFTHILMPRRYRKHMMMNVPHYSRLDMKRNINANKHYWVYNNDIYTYLELSGNIYIC